MPISVYAVNAASFKVVLHKPFQKIFFAYQDFYTLVMFVSSSLCISDSIKNHCVTRFSAVFAANLFVASVDSCSHVQPPLLPNPPMPRSDKLSCSTTSNSTRGTCTSMAWAMRSPGLINSCFSGSQNSSSMVSFTITSPV